MPLSLFLPGRRRDHPDVKQFKSANDPSRCSGQTIIGRQCALRTRRGPALIDQLNDDELGEIERFCYRHSARIFRDSSGFYSKKNSQWLHFEYWIPRYLQSDTQLALRAAMEKPRPLLEQPGYLYILEIQDPDSPETVRLKVGRATNFRQMDEWKSHYGSSSPLLRGWYPSTEDPEALMKGRLDPGPPVPTCDRLERLIHLELADLIASEIYLHPKWPNVKAASKNRAKDPKSKECPDCGQKHRDDFVFTRLKADDHAGTEWEDIVMPVIEKWGRFVESYL
ncbi:hypothetical protein DL96DRAFT_1473895 [Flagelloscypha sp. PMI_526]|nr:hypothetical protein DL96DRAFT_1473895 [Flagelloscypha sp. PMI_526]